MRRLVSSKRAPRLLCLFSLIALGLHLNGPATQGDDRLRNAFTADAFNGPVDPDSREYKQLKRVDGNITDDRNWSQVYADLVELIPEGGADDADAALREKLEQEARYLISRLRLADSPEANEAAMEAVCLLADLGRLQTYVNDLHEIIEEYPGELYARHRLNRVVTHCPHPMLSPTFQRLYRLGKWRDSSNWIRSSDDNLLIISPDAIDGLLVNYSPFLRRSLELAISMDNLSIWPRNRLDSYCRDFKAGLDNLLERGHLTQGTLRNIATQWQRLHRTNSRTREAVETMTRLMLSRYRPETRQGHETVLAGLTSFQNPAEKARCLVRLLLPDVTEYLNDPKAFTRTKHSSAFPVHAHGLWDGAQSTPPGVIIFQQHGKQHAFRTQLQRTLQDFAEKQQDHPAPAWLATQAEDVEACWHIHQRDLAALDSIRRASSVAGNDSSPYRADFLYSLAKQSLAWKDTRLLGLDLLRESLALRQRHGADDITARVQVADLAIKYDENDLAREALTSTAQTRDQPIKPTDQGTSATESAKSDTARGQAVGAVTTNRGEFIITPTDEQLTTASGPRATAGQFALYSKLLLELNLFDEAAEALRLLTVRTGPGEVELLKALPAFSQSALQKGKNDLALEAAIIFETLWHAAQIKEPSTNQFTTHTVLQGYQLWSDLGRPQRGRAFAQFLLDNIDPALASKADSVLRDMHLIRMLVGQVDQLTPALFQAPRTNANSASVGWDMTATRYLDSGLVTTRARDIEAFDDRFVIELLGQTNNGGLRPLAQIRNADGRGVWKGKLPSWAWSIRAIISDTLTDRVFLVDSAVVCGGRNLIGNARFYGVPDDWEAITQQITIGQWSFQFTGDSSEAEPSLPEAAEQSLWRLTSSSPVPSLPAVEMRPVRGGNYEWLGQAIPIDPKREYFLSGWILQGRHGSPLQIGLRQFDDKGERIRDAMIYANSPPGEWRYARAVIRPTNSPRGVPVLTLDSRTARVRPLILYKGRAATKEGGTAAWSGLYFGQYPADAEPAE